MYLWHYHKICQTCCKSFRGVFYLYYISVTMRYGQYTSKMDNSIFISCPQFFPTLILFDSNKERENFSKFSLSCLLVQLISSRLEICIWYKDSDILHQTVFYCFKQEHIFNLLPMASEGGAIMALKMCLYIY